MNYNNLTDPGVSLPIFKTLRDIDTCHDIILKSQNVSVTVAQCMFEPQLGITLDSFAEIDMSQVLDPSHMNAFLDAIHYLDMSDPDLHLIPVIIATLMLGMENVFQMLICKIKLASFKRLTQLTLWRFVTFTKYMRILSLQRCWAEKYLQLEVKARYNTDVVYVSPAICVRYCPNVYIQNDTLYSSVGLSFENKGLREKATADLLPPRNSSFRSDYQRNILLYLMQHSHSEPFTIRNNTLILPIHRAILLASCEYLHLSMNNRWNEKSDGPKQESFYVKLNDEELHTLVGFIYCVPTDDVTERLVLLANYRMFYMRFSMMWHYITNLSKPTTIVSVQQIKNIFTMPEFYTRANIHHLLRYIAKQKILTSVLDLACLPEEIIAAMRLHHRTWLNYRHWVHAHNKPLSSCIRTNPPSPSATVLPANGLWMVEITDSGVYTYGHREMPASNCVNCKQTSDAINDVTGATNDWWCICHPMQWFRLCTYEPDSLIDVWTDTFNPILKVRVDGIVYRFYTNGETWRESQVFAAIHSDDINIIPIPIKGIVPNSEQSLPSSSHTGISAVGTCPVFVDDYVTDDGEPSDDIDDKDLIALAYEEIDIEN